MCDALVMTRSVSVALSFVVAACGGSEKPAPTTPPAAAAPPAQAEDDCERVTARLQPVLEDLTKESGKSFGPAERSAMVKQCREGLAAGKRDPIMDCVLAAADDAAVRTCFQDALVAYQNAAAGARVDCRDAAACTAKAAELDATDPEMATEAHYAACLHGSSEGCEEAGLRWMKQTDGRQRHPLDRRIVDSWRRSCEIGKGLHGCGNLGSAYFFGLWGTPVDGDKGIEYWTTSCKKQGNKFICRKLEQAKRGDIKPGVTP